MDNRISPDKLTIYWFLFLILTTSLAEAVESITGRRQPCSNEGEEVKLDTIPIYSRCFKCVCQNGFVECEKESCPSVEDCYLLEKRPAGGCCEKCKECVFKGVRYPSGTEWSDPEDSCISFKCIAGVVTETRQVCYTPCSNPLPPIPGQCCPTCLNCHLNGQHVHDGREVTLSEDPCLKCHCSNKRLTCLKKACPVLTCPISKQVHVPGECCPRCAERREIMQVKGKCIIGKGFHADGKQFKADHCSSCTCVNGTSVCQRDTCPILECSVESQKTNPGDCCPHCPPVSEARTTCTFHNRTFENDETWNLNPCKSCKCHAGKIRCALTNCPKVRCRPNETLVTPEGQCCAKCVESAGICTVFGDPHYKTFDGKFFSFSGSCKYQLTADCRNHSFSIRVTNDGVSRESSSKTKSVTLKAGSTRLNLAQKHRVKVNGTRVTLPFNHSSVLQIERRQDSIFVTTDLGIKLEWDGIHFLQVEVPARYKNHLCGLCGNYNGMARDDLTARNGKNFTEKRVFEFANSWKVGGRRSCGRLKDPKHPVCKPNEESWLRCENLKTKSDVFGDCDSRLNPDNYYESCKLDMCDCPSGMCYCDSIAAYAHECQRLGVVLPNWRKSTQCPVGVSSHHYHKAIYRPPVEKKIRTSRKKSRRPDFYRHVPKALLIPNRTNQKPPPLYEH